MVDRVPTAVMEGGGSVGGGTVKFGILKSVELNDWDDGLVTR